jgi:hypothetical protein
MCIINRASIYVMLGISMNLCALMYKIASAMVRGTPTQSMATLNFLSTVTPILLLMLGYAMETELDDGKNARINIARHSFTCSMRLDSLLNMCICPFYLGSRFLNLITLHHTPLFQLHFSVAGFPT